MKYRKFIGMTVLLIGLCGCQNTDLEETTEIPDMQTETEADTMESSQEETEVSVAEVIPEESEYLSEEESESTETKGVEYSNIYYLKEEENAKVNCIYDQESYECLRYLSYSVDMDKDG